VHAELGAAAVVFANSVKGRETNGIPGHTSINGCSIPAIAERPP